MGELFWRVTHKPVQWIARHGQALVAGAFLGAAAEALTNGPGAVSATVAGLVMGATVAFVLIVLAHAIVPR